MRAPSWALPSWADVHVWNFACGYFAWMASRRRRTVGDEVGSSRTRRRVPPSDDAVRRMFENSLSNSCQVALLWFPKPPPDWRVPLRGVVPRLGSYAS